LAALLLILSIVDPAGFGALRTIGTEITAPVARFFTSVRQTFTDVASNTSAYLDAASKNAALNKEVQANRRKVIEAKAINLENQRLRQLLDLKQTEAGHVAIGRLISSSASSSRRLATLSIGSNMGVSKGQPVRSPNGLIGRIVETGPTTSRVLLITDANSPVPVMRATDGVAASGEGLANGMVAVRPVSFGINPFKVGDIIVTSGNGGLFRPNIPCLTRRQHLMSWCCRYMKHPQRNCLPRLTLNLSSKTLNHEEHAQQSDPAFAIGPGISVKD
jgi:rod shape-determining protein MreC